MEIEKKVISFLENHNGYISTSDFLSMGINKTYIKKYIDLKFIKKVSKGLYIDYNLIEDEYYILSYKYPDVVFSNNTAFHLLNLTNRTPYKIDVTVPNNKKVRGNYTVHRISNKYYSIGIIEILTPYKNTVKVYNAERSICDMLKNEYELEQKNRILDNYFKSSDKDIDKLLEYSKLLNVYDKVNTLVEVMMKW